jgi:TonB family protein
VIESTLVLLVAWCVAKAVPRQSAAERHLVWVAGLCSAVIVPLLGTALETWRPYWVRTVADFLPSLPRPAFTPVSSAGADVVVRAEELAGSGSLLVEAAAMVWGLGAAWLLTASAVRMWHLKQLATAAIPIVDRAWPRLAAELVHSLGVRRPVALFYSRAVAVPVTWGVWRPRIVFPRQAAAWSISRRRAVLAHELAHVRRWDWPVQILSQLICAVCWFHPLFWVGCRQLRHESERACDDVVVNLGVDAADYAAHLLSIMRDARSIDRRWRSALAAVRPGELERRFAALLETPGQRRAVSRLRVAAVAALTAAFGLPLAAAGVAPFAEATIRVRTGTYPSSLDTIAVARTPPPQSIRSVRAVDAGSGGGILVAPRVLEYSTPPLYSDEARTRRIEGVVTIEARVRVDGRASALRVVKGLGYGLDENALVALRQWQFRPGEREGVPVEMAAQIDIEFSLRNEALNELIANDMATRIGAGVTPPRIIRTVSVPAQRSGEERAGTVALDVILLEDGTPKIVRVLHSLTRPLDERAVEAFEQWRFSPAIKAGRPVKVRLQADITFH